MISKCSGEDQDHGELEEGLVGFGFSVAAGRDAGAVAHPGVAAFDRPAVFGLWVWGFEAAFLAAPDFAHGCAEGDRFAATAGTADARLDRSCAQRCFELGRVVAAVGPQLARLDATREQRVDERQQVAAFVFVAGREPDLERQPGRVDG